MADYKLGRLPAPDPRDQRYPMRLMLDPLREQFFPRGLPDGARHYRPGPILDQGNTGTCVAHGWTTRINSAPIMQQVSLTPYNFYRRIVAVDEFSQNDFEANAPDSQLQFGTSVRAGAKVSQELGYLKNYLWAESVEDIRSWHLAGFGGLVMGTVWTSGMFETDSDGFVRVTGGIEGGHCYATTGWNDQLRRGGRRVRALRCQQSWGDGWGQKGRFWILEDDVEKLRADDGEACAPVEQKIAA